MIHKDSFMAYYRFKSILNRQMSSGNMMFGLIDHALSLKITIEASRESERLEKYKRSVILCQYQSEKKKADDLELFWTGGFESLTFVESTVNQGKPINILAQSFYAWFTE